MAKCIICDRDYHDAEGLSPQDRCPQYADLCIGGWPDHGFERHDDYRLRCARFGLTKSMEPRGDPIKTIRELVEKAGRELD